MAKTSKASPDVDQKGMRRALARLWRSRSILAAPVAWRGLRWLDKPLAVLLRTQPRWLSSRVKVRRVPFQGTLLQRSRMWLWEKHSVNIGMLFAVTLALGICALSLAIASFAPIPLLGLQSDVDGIPTMIIATAAYLGGLFGFLQAVAIFAVQIRSQQDSSSLPLTPLIARRYFTFFILSAIAGVTIANLLAALAAPLLPIDRHAFGVLSWLNMITVPVATVAAFWYLATIVSEAGDEDLDVALPVLRATMRAQAYADAVQAQLRQEFKDVLQSAGIASDQFIEFKLRDRRTAVHRVSLGRVGKVYDMDCHRLDAIAKMLRGMSSIPEVALTASIGQLAGKDHFLVLMWEVPGDESAVIQAEVPIGEAQRQKIASAARRLLATRQGQGG